RLVRDARQSREVARRPLPEAARQHQLGPVPPRATGGPVLGPSVAANSMSHTPYKPISYQPTEGMSYDPEETKYWDASALQQEVTRGFELCHGCRMCFKYCDSFPILFDLVDRLHDADVRRITEPETEKVMDACFQ